MGDPERVTDGCASAADACSGAMGGNPGDVDGGIRRTDLARLDLKDWYWQRSCIIRL